MQSSTIYYGDILYLYIFNIFPKNTKSYLSEYLGYSRASSFREFLLRNQQHPAERLMLEAIESVYGLNNFIKLLEEHKTYFYKTFYDTQYAISEVRFGVIQSKSHYYKEIYHAITNEKQPKLSGLTPEN